MKPSGQFIGEVHLHSGSLALRMELESSSDTVASKVYIVNMKQSNPWWAFFYCNMKQSNPWWVVLIVLKIFLLYFIW